MAHEVLNMAGPDERPDAPAEAPPSRSNVTVVVPDALVQGTISLLTAFRLLLQLDEVITIEEERAKALAGIRAVGAMREVRAAWRNSLRPLIRAYERLTGQKFPEGPDTGRLSKKQADMVGPVLMPGASFITIGEGAAATLVAKLGVKGAAKAVAMTGVEVQASTRAARGLLSRLLTRGVLPAAAVASMSAGFQNCGKVVGAAVGVLVALKLVGSKAGRAALAEAAPVLIAVGAAWLFLKRRR